MGTAVVTSESHFRILAWQARSVGRSLLMNPIWETTPEWGREREPHPTPSCSHSQPASSALPTPRPAERCFANAPQRLAPRASPPCGCKLHRPTPIACSLGSVPPWLRMMLCTNQPTRVGIEYGIFWLALQDRGCNEGLTLSRQQDSQG